MTLKYLHAYNHIKNLIGLDFTLENNHKKYLSKISLTFSMGKAIDFLNIFFMKTIEKYDA